MRAARGNGEIIDGLQDGSLARVCIAGQSHAHRRECVTRKITATPFTTSVSCDLCFSVGQIKLCTPIRCC